jgi:hypothetical protein
MPGKYQPYITADMCLLFGPLVQSMMGAKLIQRPVYVGHYARCQATRGALSDQSRSTPCNWPGIEGPPSNVKRA